MTQDRTGCTVRSQDQIDQGPKWPHTPSAAFKSTTSGWRSWTPVVTAELHIFIASIPKNSDTVQIYIYIYFISCDM